MKSPRKSFKNAERVLPPDVYDALELSAFVFKGVGCGEWWDRADERPCCIHGHAAAVEGDGMQTDRALIRVGIHEAANDDAFSAGEHSHGARISFREWCKRLNVVRADTPTFDPENFPAPRPAKRSLEARSLSMRKGLQKRIARGAR